jgi:hypothetical protein
MFIALALTHPAAAEGGPTALMDTRRKAAPGDVEGHFLEPGPNVAALPPQAGPRRDPGSRLFIEPPIP